MGTTLFEIGAAYFFKRQFDEAASKLLLAIQDDPGLANPHRFLAACYAHMGRLDEARAIVAKAARPHPSRRAIRFALPQPRGPRAIAVGPAGRDGRCVMSQIQLATHV